MSFCAELGTMMQDVGHLQFKNLMERIWRQQRERRLSTSSAMTGGKHSVHSMSFKRQRKLKHCCASKKRYEHNIAAVVLRL